jgi:hypothetical protein
MRVAAGWLSRCVYITIHVRMRGRLGAGRSSAAAPPVGKNIDGDSDEMQREREREPAPRFARATKGQQTRRRALTHNQSFCLGMRASPGQINGKEGKSNKSRRQQALSIHAAGPRIEWRARGHLKMNEHAKCKPVFLIRRGAHFHSERCQMCDAGTRCRVDVKIDPHNGESAPECCRFTSTRLP